MDMKLMVSKAGEWIKKYRYAMLVLAIGIGLMIIPTPTKNTRQIQESPRESEVSQTMEERLEEILCQIQGAGRVEVMLTVGLGEETVYQLNEDSVISDTTSSVQTKAVTVTDSDRNQNGLIRQIIPPEYLGAIVVCQGGGDPQVQLAIVNAVSKVTGLGADRISVLKMK